MVFGGQFVRIAGVRFTNQQAQFLVAGIRQGLGVRELRQVFRDNFGRGLPSASFTATRRTLTAGELTGIRIQRSAAGRAIRVTTIPKVEVVRASHRFIVTGRVRAIIPATGQVIERVIRFGTDTAPDIGSITARAQEILDKGVAQLESAMRLDKIDSLSIIEQVEL